MPLLHQLRQAARGLTLRALLPSMVRRRPLPELLRSLEPQAEGRPPPRHDPARLASRLFRPSGLWPTTCLYRALGSYTLLRAAGQAVRFVIGVRREGGALQAHAWVERDGEIVVGAPGPGVRYAVAYAWPEAPAGPGSSQGETTMTAIERSADAVLTELQDGTGVLLHLQTRFYFTLNDTGVRVWKLIGEGARDAGDLARRLAAAFPGTDPDRIRTDVEALLADLAGESLVSLVG